MALSCAKGILSIAAGATGAHTVTGLSFQPKAVMFFGAHTNTTGSYVADEDIMFGAATSSTQEWVIHASSNNQATTSLTSRGHSAANSIRGMINGAPAAIDFAADFTAFTADGFTVNVSNAPTNALTIHYLAFGGTDITNAKAGAITLPTSGGLAFTDPGFQPDMVLFAHTWADGAHYRFSLGVTDGTTAKRIHYGQVSASATVQSSTLQNTGSYFSGASNAFGPDMDIGFVSLDATGFTLGGGTPDYPAVAATAYYLAIEGGQWAVGTETEGTTAAARDTSLAFTPKGLLLFGMGSPTFPTYSSALDGKLAIGASDGTNEGVVWNGNDDAHADNPSFKRNDVARAFWHANPATTIAGPPTTVNEADATFAANKFTLTWNAAGASREFIYLAAGDSSAGPTTHYGASSLTVNVGLVTANKRTTFSTSAATITFGFTTAGRRKTFGVSASTITFGFTTANRRKTFGVSSTPIVFGLTTAPKLTARTSTSLPVVFGIASNAVIAGGVVTHYGASSQTLTFGLATANRRKTFGVSAATLAFGITTAQRLRARASSALTLAFGITTAPRLRARASSSTPIVFGLTSSGFVPGAIVPNVAGSVLVLAGAASGVTLTTPATATVTASNGHAAAAAMSTEPVGNVLVGALAAPAVTISETITDTSYGGGVYGEGSYSA